MITSGSTATLNASVPALETPYTPDQIRNAYGVDNIVFGPAGNTITGNGGNETIAVLEYGDDPNFQPTTETAKTASTLYPITWSKSDLAIFNRDYDLEQLAGGLQIVNDVGGTRPSYKTIGLGFESETAMDVEWANAMAPLATIDLVEMSVGQLQNAVMSGVQAMVLRSW